MIARGPVRVQSARWRPSSRLTGVTRGRTGRPRARVYFAMVTSMSFAVSTRASRWTVRPSLSCRETFTS